jgi:hypothetical protein
VSWHQSNFFGTQVTQHCLIEGQIYWIFLRNGDRNAVGINLPFQLSLRASRELLEKLQMMEIFQESTLFRYRRQAWEVGLYATQPGDIN